MINVKKYKNILFVEFSDNLFSYFGQWLSLVLWIYNFLILWNKCCISTCYSSSAGYIPTYLIFWYFVRVTSGYVMVAKGAITGVLAQSLERPPHNREVVGFDPRPRHTGYVKNGSCLVWRSTIRDRATSIWRCSRSIGQNEFSFRFNKIWSGLKGYYYYYYYVTNCVSLN